MKLKNRILIQKLISHLSRRKLAKSILRHRDVLQEEGNTFKEASTEKRVGSGGELTRNKAVILGYEP